jgi:hypothetical protein
MMQDELVDRIGSWGSAWVGPSPEGHCAMRQEAGIKSRHMLGWYGAKPQAFF